jgi:hypothetical protein
MLRGFEERAIESEPAEAIAYIRREARLRRSWTSALMKLREASAR